MRERSDIQPKWVAYFLAALAILGAAVFVGNWLLFRVLSKATQPEKYSRSLVRPENALPSAPRLQISPEADNREFIRHESEVLNEYGWVDAQKGVAHIPIDRAMQLIVERGTK